MVEARNQKTHAEIPHLLPPVSRLAATTVLNSTDLIGFVDKKDKPLKHAAAQVEKANYLESTRTKVFASSNSNTIEQPNNETETAGRLGVESRYER
jgi:hypothetical protein